jgi:hypothetical protein
MLRLSRCPLLLACLALLSACGLPDDSPGRRQVGVNPEERLHAPYLSIPDTVAVAQSVEISVTTTGPDGCYSADGVEVRSTGDVIQLTPHHRVAHSVCTHMPVELQHAVALRFDTPGERTVQILARSDFRSGTVSLRTSKRVVVR